MWLREKWVQDVHMGAYFLACSLGYSVAIYNVHADYINKSKCTIRILILGARPVKMADTPLHLPAASACWRLRLSIQPAGFGAAFMVA